MIQSFADAATKDIFDGKNTKAARAFDQQLWTVMRRKLDRINQAHELRDLFVPPSNRLELLKGDLAGLYSIRINEQYRIVFAFADGHAHNVRITDYH